MSRRTKEVYDCVGFGHDREHLSISWYHDAQSVCDGGGFGDDHNEDFIWSQLTIHTVKLFYLAVETASCGFVSVGVQAMEESGVRTEARGLSHHEIGESRLACLEEFLAKSRCHTDGVSGAVQVTTCCLPACLQHLCERIDRTLIAYLDKDRKQPAWSSTVV